MGAFVLVHGFWHNHATWAQVVPRLEAAGHMVAAPDLPGAGANARVPASYLERPLNLAAFATEPSPNAGVGQAERTAAARAAVEDLASRTGGKVVLAGHSMGGATIASVAEEIPDSLAAVVFITAFMLPPGMPPIAMIQHPTMAAALVPGLLMADPMAVGALRIDFASSDPEYRARIKDAFYGDVSDSDFAEALARKHPDEPAGVVGVPSPVTSERFGKVARHYVRCTADQAIVPAGQDYMIAAMDAAMAAAGGAKTIVHSLDASHSPFYSRPDALAGLLARIVG